MAREITVQVTYKRGDGVVLSRSVFVQENPYSRRHVSDFKSSAKRKGMEAINSVLGLPAGVEIVNGA